MEITIYRRHIKRCSQKDDRYAPRCGCPLSGQFNWPQSTTKFDGKKLKHGQNKWSLNARTWSEAQQNATKLERDLEALIQGKPPASPSPLKPPCWSGSTSGRKSDSPTQSQS